METITENFPVKNLPAVDYAQAKAINRLVNDETNKLRKRLHEVYSKSFNGRN